MPQALRSHDSVVPQAPWSFDSTGSQSRLLKENTELFVASSLFGSSLYITYHSLKANIALLLRASSGARAVMKINGSGAVSLLHLHGVANTAEFWLSSVASTSEFWLGNVGSRAESPKKDNNKAKKQKKIKMVLGHLFWDQEELFSEKKITSKISWHCPFKCKVSLL